MTRITIVFVVHDDGTGAFFIMLVTLAALARHLSAGSLRVIVLNSSEPDAEKRLREAVEGCDVEIVYVKTDNLCRIPKKDGEVDLERVPELVAGLADSSSRWPEGVEIDWKTADLVISIGVPWAHEKATDTGVPSIELGDMIWSFVYGGMCTSPRSEAVERALGKLKSVERLADAAYFIPYMAPAEYDEYMRELDVPVAWTRAGSFWTGEPAPYDPKAWKHTICLREALRSDLKNVKDEHVQLVAINCGHTPVWEEILERLRRTRVPADLAFIRSERGRLWLLEHPHIELVGTSALRRRLSSLDFSRALSSAVALVIARSAGGVLGGVCGRTPPASAEEPGHSLGERQRRAVLGQDPLGGICERRRIALPLDLAAFRANPVDATRALLNDDEYARLCTDLQSVPNGIEQDLVRMLAQKYPQIVRAAR